MKLPFHDCPRFETCSVNVCPLDPFRNEKNSFSDEKDCPMEKRVRLRLGKDLPWLGLTKAEFKAKNRWERLPEEEKQAMRQRMLVIRQKQ